MTRCSHCGKFYEGSHKCDEQKPPQPQGSSVVERLTTLEATVEELSETVVSLIESYKSNVLESNKSNYTNAAFDRKAYQKEYMRKKRAKKANPQIDNNTAQWPKPYKPPS